MDYSSVEVMQRELGKRLETFRLNKNMTQARLAKEAGVSERTVIRVEQGHSIQLANFFKILKVLNLSEHLDALVPETVPSPIQQLSLQGKKRQRASSPKSKNEAKVEWTWGDDE